MPRHMSFSMTTEAVRNREKTVTRRLGWDFLKPGDVLWAVEKGMGLKKGEKVKKLCQIEVVSNLTEWLDDLYDYNPIAARFELECEGFPDMTPREFIQMFCDANGCRPHVPVNRIEFEYLDARQVEMRAEVTA